MSVRRAVLAVLVVGVLLAAYLRLSAPASLMWKDRRPIASLIISTSAAGWRGNPRGWLLDPHLDVETPAGVEEFHRRLLAWADCSIAIMREVGAQGMITWDIEGQQFPHKTSFVGDPRLTDQLAPEMAEVADEYFRRFRAAGFRVGVTVRPQKFVLSGDRKSATQSRAADPEAVLLAKIRYARARWGATLFYIDSNGNPLFAMDSAMTRRVAAAVPDALLIPERSNWRYFAATAPYGEMRKGFFGTGLLERLLYPGAFSVINTSDGEVEQNESRMRVAVRSGDVLMFRGWFDAPENGVVRRLAAISRRDLGARGER